jgi:hypothetical protein
MNEKISVKFGTYFSRNTNKMQLCNRMYYSKVYWRLNTFRAANRSSSGALNCICGLWFICPYGDRPLSKLSGGIFFTQPWAHKPEAAIQLKLRMMSGVPLETCSAFKKLWNNKFYYKAASCWYFYWVIYDARIHGYKKKDFLPFIKLKRKLLSLFRKLLLCVIKNCVAHLLKAYRKELLTAILPFEKLLLVCVWDREDKRQSWVFLHGGHLNVSKDDNR